MTNSAVGSTLRVFVASVGTGVVSTALVPLDGIQFHQYCTVRRIDRRCQLAAVGRVVLEPHSDRERAMSSNESTTTATGSDGSARPTTRLKELINRTDRVLSVLHPP